MNKRYDVQTGLFKEGIYASMASIPNRVNLLKDSVMSIKDQVDKLFI